MNKYVQMTVDVECEWENSPPIYRLFVNNDMLAERTWIWSDFFLQEVIQLNAPGGVYTIRVEPVGSTTAKFKLGRPELVEGPVRWLDKNNLMFQIV
jgi:hypothetical protein